MNNARRLATFYMVVATTIGALIVSIAAADEHDSSSPPAATPHPHNLENTFHRVSSPESELIIRKEVLECPETCEVTTIPEGHDRRCYASTCDKSQGICITTALSGGLFDGAESSHSCSTIPQRCNNGKLEDAPELATSTSREGEYCDSLSNGGEVRTGRCDPPPACVRGQCVQNDPLPNCSEDECNLYRLNMQIDFLAKQDDSANGPGGAYSGTGRPDQDPVRYNDTGLACLDEIFQDAREAADTFIAGGNSQRIDFRGTRETQYWDDRFAKYLMWGDLKFNWNNDCTPEEKHKVYIPGQNYYDYVDKVCRKVTTFFDKNCKKITNPLTTNACKSAEVLIYLSSPISLQWDGTEKVGSTVSVVSFPLHPAETDASWIWKASDKLPLLVYDPEHKGEITSAQQLFGNWTFGGQRSASAGIDGASLARPWNNGYEALETLDTDGDGKVSGNELAPLALWFDGDRDGVSQPGEVVPATKTGLQELYFRSPTTNPATKDVELAIGFKRIEDSGQERVGASVDWYSDRARDPGELFMRHVNQDFNKTGSKIPELPPTTSPNSTGALHRGSHAHIAGAWEWNFSGEHLNQGHKVGVLVFTQYDDGRVLGRSIVQAPVVGNSDAATMIYTSLLDGTFTDTNSFSFYVASGDGIIQSEAQVQSDGSRIEGKTVFTGKGQKQVIYKWVAKRKSFSASPK